MVTETLETISITLLTPAASTVVLLELSPEMVRSSLMSRSPVTLRFSPTAPGIDNVYVPAANVIESAPAPAGQASTAASVLAACMASRREQSPSAFSSSAVVFTVMVAA